MVKSKDKTDFLTKSILKSEDTQSPPFPHHALPPPHSTQLSYSLYPEPRPRPLPALPPQARSRSLSPPVQASQCCVNQNSLSHSRNGTSGTVKREQQENKVKKVVSFCPVITAYSPHGDIIFTKNLSTLPGGNTFRHRETSTPVKRRKQPILPKTTSTTSNKLSTLSYTTDSHSGAPKSTTSTGSPNSSSSSSKRTVRTPNNQVIRHRLRGRIENEHLQELREGRQQSSPCHQTKTHPWPQTRGQSVFEETC